MLEFLIGELNLDGYESDEYYDSDGYYDSDSDMSSLNFDDHELISFERPFPKLQKIAMVQHVGYTWKHRDFEQQVRDHHLDFQERRLNEGEHSFRELEKKVKDKLKQYLPSKLYKEAAILVRPIGYQIFEWMGFVQRTCSNLCDYLPIQNFICWNMIGTIDKRKTFEALLEKKRREITLDLYKMSCYYCLEDHILRLVKDVKGYIHYKESDKEEGYFLISHWTRLAKRVRGRAFYWLENKAKEMLMRSIKDGNFEAVRYFWAQLPEECRSEDIVSFATGVTCSFSQHDDDDVESIEYQRCNEFTAMLCFFLSEMEDGAQQMSLFMGRSEEVVRMLFYNLPWRPFLLPTLKNMWHERNNVERLDEDQFGEFLLIVAKEMEKGAVEEGLVRDIWRESPPDYKLFSINCQYSTKTTVHTLFSFCKSGNVEIVRMILANASFEDKKRVARELVKSVFDHESIVVGEIGTMNMLIRECISSEEEISEMKGELVEEIGDDLCMDFVIDSDFELADKFISWCFTTNAQIECFKRNVLDKSAVVRVLASQGKFEEIDKFLKWSLCSDEKILELKKEVANSSGDIFIASLAHEEWNLFEKFVTWCFESDEELNEFKKKLLPEMNSLVSKMTALGHGFESAEKLLKWFFESEEEVLRFKKDLVLSEEGREMFKMFVKSFEQRNEDFFTKLVEWYRPVGKEVLQEFEAKLRREGRHRSDPLRTSFALLRKLNQMLNSGNEDPGSVPSMSQGARRGRNRGFRKNRKKYYQ